MTIYYLLLIVLPVSLCTHMHTHIMLCKWDRIMTTMTF